MYESSTVMRPAGTATTTVLPLTSSTTWPPVFIWADPTGAVRAIMSAARMIGTDPSEFLISLTCFQIIFAKPPIERRGRYSQQLCRLAAVPAGLLECIQYLLSLDVAKIRRGHVMERADAVRSGCGITYRHVRVLAAIDDFRRQLSNRNAAVVG